MVNCQGCGEETSSRLCCPKCSEYGRTSFFCSQECFVSSWPSHSKLHVIIRQLALSTDSSSTYDGCSCQRLTADDAGPTSPATTAASVSVTSDESTFRKKGHVGLISAHVLETHSRSRVLSRAQSETELPVVSSSAASSSFSHGTAVDPASSSLSSSRDPPVLSPASAVPTDERTTVTNAPYSGSNYDKDSTAGGVLNAVRSLLLPRNGDKTGGGKGQGLRSAAAATGSAAARVTETVRSVFSTSYGRHQVDPSSIRKKDTGPTVREASGRTTAAGTTASPAGVGFCRRVLLAVVCAFCLWFMWLMKRVLFDGAGSSSAYYTGHTGDVAINRSEAQSDSNDVVSAVLARIGARPYGEEFSALQASVHDIRNELAAITTLVQQHNVVIDQFIEKPNFSGRRQGSGGAINQAISAVLEGGPPLPEAPPLKLPLLASAADVSDRNRVTGLSGTAQQEAVASLHSVLRTGEAVAAGGTRETHANTFSQSFSEASVTPEGVGTVNQESMHQHLLNNVSEQQQSEDGRRQPATESKDARGSQDMADGTPSTDGLSSAAAVKSALQPSGSDDFPGSRNMLHPSASGVSPLGAGVSANTEGGIPPTTETVKDMNEDIQRGEPAQLYSSQAGGETLKSSSQAGDVRPAELFMHASDERGSTQDGRLSRTAEEENSLTGISHAGGEQENNQTSVRIKKTREQHGKRVWQALRGNGDREEDGGREDESNKAGEATVLVHDNERSHATKQSPFVPFGLGSASIRGAKRARRG